MSEPLTTLKRLPRPVPLFAGVRPFPWLAVHEAGHPHEGRPVTREVRCPELVSRDGECCDTVFPQQMIDRAWLAAQPARRRLAFQEQCPADEDGTMWDRARCNRHERAALEREAEGTDRVQRPEPAWYDSLDRRPEAEPPLSDELFGGRI